MKTRRYEDFLSRVCAAREASRPRRYRAFLATLLLAAAAACAPARKTHEEKPMQTQEWKGSRGGPDAPGSAVGADAPSWNALWRTLGQAPPPLDLDKFVGVAVFAGSRPTGGWKIALAEPLTRGADLVVRYRVLKPGGFATQAFTSPWLVRAVPRPAGRVIVEAESE